MTSTYTFGVYCSLDGCGSYGEDGDWGKEGDEFLDHRLAVLSDQQRTVLGANTFRQWTELLGPIDESELDPVNARMKTMPATVVSTTLTGRLDWPEARLVSGDAVDVIATFDGRIQELVYRPTLH